MMVSKSRREWKTQCTLRVFCIEDGIDAEIVLYEISPSSLISCVFEGVYRMLKDEHIFICTESVPLCAGSTEESVCVQYSIVLPSGVPPSYSGTNAGIYYYLKVFMHEKDKTDKQIIPIRLWSRNYLTENMRGKGSYELVSAKYVSVSERGSKSEKPENNLILDKNICAEVVNALRLRKDNVKQDKNSREGVCNMIQRIERMEIKEVVSKAYALEKERETDLSIISALRRKEIVQVKERVYSIKKEGEEIASLLLSLSSDSAPYWSLHAKITFTSPGDHLNVSIIHTEKAERERKETIYAESKDICNCTFLTLRIPLDLSLYPVIITPFLTTHIEMKVEIDTFSAIIKVGEIN